MRQNVIGPRSPRQKKFAAYLRTPEWKAKVEQVKARCGGICEHCHKLEVNHVHHLTYDRIYNEDLDDLLGVCEPCHEFLHELRKDDGAAVSVEIERQKDSLERQRASINEAKVRAVEESERQSHCPGNYETRACKDYRKAMRLFRQYTFLLKAGWLSVITDVAYSVRKWNPSGVDFWLWHSWVGGHRGNRIETADISLEKGDILFDNERQIWCVKTGAELCGGAMRRGPMSPKKQATRQQAFQRLSDKVIDVFG